jgi:signal transduction histidine kinase
MVANMEPAHASDPALSEELASGLAHEIRNQLNSLHIHLGILDRELSDLAADKRTHVAAEVAGITRSLSAIDDFLSDFLLYTRPQQIQCAPADARAIVRELVAFLAPEAAARGIALSADVADAPDQAVIDAVQLKRALLNLVLNGLEATPKGGHVEIVSATRPDAWTLTIRDSGPGIPPHVRDRLFSPFVSGGSGAGLGLPIARRIINAHGGSIDASSAARRGTELHVTLPRGARHHG